MEKDVIYRQDAIDVLGDKPLAWTEGEYELGMQNQWQSDVDALKALPSAQQKRTEECTETHACDCISRQAAIDELRKCQTYLFDERDPDKKISLESAEMAISDLPSAQPEQRPLTEDDYAYCEECDHGEMCRWYPVYGCEFKSRPSAQPEIIRCKDCEYWHREIHNGIEYFNFSSCDLNHYGDGHNFYCADAERRTDE